MTPEEAREIDRLEFEADCRAARERVFVRIAERLGAERARVLRWVNDTRPMPKRMLWVPNPAKTAVAIPRRERRPRTDGPQWAFGVARTLPEWAAHLGIPVNTLHQRIHRTGSLEAAVRIGGLKNTRPSGVVLNFPEPVGTGGGPIAQDFPEIEFSQ